MIYELVVRYKHEFVITVVAIIEFDCLKKLSLVNNLSLAAPISVKDLKVKKNNWLVIFSSLTNGCFLGERFKMFENFAWDFACIQTCSYVNILCVSP